MVVRCKTSIIGVVLGSGFVHWCRAGVLSLVGLGANKSSATAAETCPASSQTLLLAGYYYPSKPLSSPVHYYTPHYPTIIQ